VLARLRGARLRGTGARRGCDEQALRIPGIAISADVDIHLCVIDGTFVFVAASIVFMTFAFLLVFFAAAVGVLLWFFPGVAFVFLRFALGLACLPR
jgi:hypothetical protein